MKPGEKIQKLLADRGWSQSQLAQRAGINCRSISHIVSDKREPRARLCIAIAAGFGVPAEWLWDDSQNWPPPGQASFAGGPCAVADPSAPRPTIVETETHTIIIIQKQQREKPAENGAFAQS